MSSLSRELVFLILQFLDEEKFKETVHKCVYLLKIQSLVNDGAFFVALLLLRVIFFSFTGSSKSPVSISI